MKNYKYTLIIVVLFCIQPKQLYGQFHFDRLIDTLEQHIEKRKYPGLMLSIVKSDTFTMDLLV